MTQELVTTGITGIARSDVEQASARRDEPAWLREARLAAWARYEEMDFPDPYEEEWRRTDVRAMTFDGLKPLSASSPVKDAAELPAAKERVRSTLDRLNRATTVCPSRFVKFT